MSETGLLTAKRTEMGAVKASDLDLRLRPTHAPIPNESQTPAAYGDQMARYFRLDKAPSLVISPSSNAAIAITRLASRMGLPNRTSSIPSEKAFVVDMHLTPASDQACEIWIEDKYSRIMSWPAGGVGIYDLESKLHSAGLSRRSTSLVRERPGLFC